MAFFGSRTAGGTPVQAPPANNKAVSKFVLDIAGTVDHITMNFTGAGVSPTVKAVIYTDSGGSPGTLVATSDQVTSLLTVTVFPFTSPPTLSPGTYWIGVISNVQNTASCPTLTNGIAFNANTYASGPTSTFGSVTLASFVYPINCLFNPTLTPGSYLGEVLGGDDTNNYGAAGTTAVIRVNSLTGGDVSQITFYAAAPFVSANVKGVIYDATGTAGAPGALLGTSTQLTGVAINRNVLSFPTPVTAPSGDFYIGLIADTLISTHTRTALASGNAITGTYAGGPPNPFGGSPAVTNALPAFWADFVAGGQVGFYPRTIMF